MVQTVYVTLLFATTFVIDAHSEEQNIAAAHSDSNTHLQVKISSHSN